VNSKLLIVDSETTLVLSVDTNSCYVPRKIERIGIEVKRTSIIPDEIKI